MTFFIGLRDEVLFDIFLDLTFLGLKEITNFLDIFFHHIIHKVKITYLCNLIFFSFET